MSSDYQLEDTIYLPFTTRAFGTGIPTALVSGVVDIYEDVTATPIITGETLTVSLNSHAGFNMITTTATAATGFEAGKSYTAILDAGTVDSVSVIGEVVAHFTLDKSAAAVDLANATDGLGALKTLIDALNDISAADVNAQCDTALTDYNGPTSAELVSEIDAVQTDIAALNDLSAAEVNTEVVDALTVDTIAELAQAAPTATPTIASAIMLPYMALRNKLTVTGNEKGIHNDAGTKVVRKALSDDGTTYTEDKAVSGA